MNINDIFDEINLKYIFKLFEKNNDIKIPLKEINRIIGLEINNNKDFILFLLKEINKTEYDEFTFNEFKIIIDKCYVNLI
jgi:Ca2+-binding EF-hand superfamily protein